ncbi:hypothetical protein PHLGIDRAFT_36731 [Phlebiopsis gigantea 11061_1 CR5-6]|uniref:BTB domain-containing protein n=1 Tax=Phlebiopsis gigantea (strain 11061_1 CR5-6) TaxID=745531 RepID=A0A0C3PGG5_PHLG1|nr:hypothetical protein PHLGIDRAFT_36731 [Phlebiopsis gigantea 11061_1 CR5-6]
MSSLERCLTLASKMVSTYDRSVSLQASSSSSITMAAAQTQYEAANQQHPEFYFDDETIIFLVEDCYFKVHRYFFQRDSEVFRAMFSCPPGDKEPEGRTKETAILLPGVTKFEMTALLRFFYNGPFLRMYESYNSWSLKITTGEWAALLSISTRFAFDKIRARAISVLAPSSHTFNLLDSVDAIVLALKHDVPQWLETAYVLLTLRDEPLDDAEAAKLGLATTVRLARARERFWRAEAAAVASGGRLEEDVRLSAGPFSRWGMRANCPRRARATRVVHDVFWPTSEDGHAACAPRVGHDVFRPLSEDEHAARASSIAS